MCVRSVCVCVYSECVCVWVWGWVGRVEVEGGCVGEEGGSGRGGGSVGGEECGG